VRPARTPTTREWENVRLAAGALQSNEIAERLFVSTRTVDGHLDRAYVKLGVTSRKDLAWALDARNQRFGDGEYGHGQ
jgi:DNA-binding NarL/FixJ family response regulator